MKSKIRLVVVDDHEPIRSGLIALLSEMAEFQVVGEAGEGQAALQIIQSQKPDIVLLDVSVPGMSAVEILRSIKRIHDSDGCRVIMLATSKNEQDLLGAMAAGADGYLIKNAEPDDLRQAILLVHQGISVLSPQDTRQVHKSAASSDPKLTAKSPLSSREMEILACLAQRKTTILIAAELFISENTVKTHVRHILKKLAASNRVEAVSKATQMGLL